MGARLGQHFLRNTYYAALLARECHALPTETILEIGPGTGVLTRELLKTGARVVAVEKDEALAEQLTSTFASEIAQATFTLLTMDVRDFKPEAHGLRRGEYVVAANIPYYITGEIIRSFLTAECQPSRMLLLIQKEVATRIVSAKSSLLSLSVRVYGRPRIVAKVSAGNFSPPPKVDSAILAIEHISAANFRHVSPEHFFAVLHAAFAAKRKLALNNIAQKWPKEAVTAAFIDNGVNIKARAEEIPIEIWLSIARSLIS